MKHGRELLEDAINLLRLAWQPKFLQQPTQRLVERGVSELIKVEVVL